MFHRHVIEMKISDMQGVGILHTQFVIQLIGIHKSEVLAADVFQIGLREIILKTRIHGIDV